MAIVRPPQLLTGYVLLASAAAAPSQGIFIPLTSVSGLTAVEADTTTGDGRKVAFEILRAVFANYTALSTAAKPGKMAIARGTPVGVDSSTVRQTFTVSFDLDITGSDVTAEV